MKALINPHLKLHPGRDDLMFLLKILSNILDYFVGKLKMEYLFIISN